MPWDYDLIWLQFQQQIVIGVVLTVGLLLMASWGQVIPVPGPS